MDLVKSVLDQLSPDLLGKLGSSLGEGEATTAKAVSAGVPSIFSMLAGLVSNPASLEKLVSLLRNFDVGSIGKVVESMRGGHAGPAVEQGPDILGSLLGGGTLATVIGALSKFSGLGPAVGKKLLGLLTPLVLGAIAGQFKGKAVTAQGLTSLFAEQKSNIARAMPAGFSPGGLGGVPKPSGLPKWLLPVAGLALLGLLAWYFVGQPKEPAMVPPPAAEGGPGLVEPAGPAPPKVEVMPEGAKFAGDLSNIYTSATETLSGITDATSADAAEPKLKGLLGSVDALKPLWDKLPEGAKASVAAVQSKYLEPLKALVAKVVALPVIGEKLKPTLDDLVAKMTAFGG